MTTSSDKHGDKKKPPEVSPNECEIIPFPEKNRRELGIFDKLTGLTSFSIEKVDEE